MDLQKTFNVLHGNIARLGMMTTDRCFELANDEVSGNERFVFGRPITVRGRSLPMMRIVVNQIVDNATEDYAGVFVDDYVIGDSCLASRQGYVPLDDEGNFDYTSKAYPPVIWVADTGEHTIFEAPQPAPMLKLPKLADGTWAVRLQRVMANDLIQLLTPLEPESAL